MVVFPDRLGRLQEAFPHTGFVHAAGRAARSQRFKLRAHLEQLFHFEVGVTPDHGGLVGNALDQAFRRQPAERLAYRTPADTKLARQVCLDKTLARHEATAQDGLPQAIDDIFKRVACRCG
ncbi:hypothetical protein D3C80_1892840 [compost metagenome]